MRIYYAPGSDPTLRATASDLAHLRAAVLDLVESSQVSAAFDAVVSGSPAPYKALLQGLRIVKGNAAHLSISEDRWLELSGPAESITEFAQKLAPSDGGGHCHWYSMPVSLIIEPGDEGEQSVRAIAG